MLRTPKVYRFGPFLLDVIRKDVLLSSLSTPVGLTDKEFDVIHAVVAELYKNSIDRVPNEKVFTVAWPGEHIPANNNRLSVHIGRINTKLNLDRDCLKVTRDGCVLTFEVQDGTPPNPALVILVRVIFASLLSTVSAVLVTMTTRAFLAGSSLTLTQAPDAGFVAGWFQGIIGSLTWGICISGGLSSWWFLAENGHPWQARYRWPLSVAIGMSAGFFGGAINTIALLRAQRPDSLYEARWITSNDASSLGTAFTATGLGYTMLVLGPMIGLASALTAMWILANPKWKLFVSGRAKPTSLDEIARVFVAIAGRTVIVGTWGVVLPLVATALGFHVLLSTMYRSPGSVLRTLGEGLSIAFGGLGLVAGLLLGLYVLGKGIDIPPLWKPEDQRIRDGI